VDRLLSFYYWYYIVKGWPHILLHTLPPQEALKVGGAREHVPQHWGWGRGEGRGEGGKGGKGEGRCTGRT
jgi:hypothetical protein